MDEKWFLQETKNVKQVLKIRNDIDIDQSIKEFPHLLLVSYDFKELNTELMSVDQMMIFFTMFENNHLESLEEENRSALLAVNIENGIMQFYLYCKDCTQTMAEIAVYLNSNEYCECDYSIYEKDSGETLFQWI